MINHSNCDHPSTSSARAKCRRGGVQGPKRKVMGKQEREERDADTYGQTPRDRHLQCDNCGVERISLRGTDPLDGILKYVGERCEYVVRHAPDITPLD